MYRGNYNEKKIKTKQKKNDDVSFFTNEITDRYKMNFFKMFLNNYRWSFSRDIPTESSG
jgi:hypothetical protein